VLLLTGGRVWVLLLLVGRAPGSQAVPLWCCSAAVPLLLLLLLLLVQAASCFSSSLLQQLLHHWYSCVCCRVHHKHKAQGAVCWDGVTRSVIRVQQRQLS